MKREGRGRVTARERVFPIDRKLWCNRLLLAETISAALVLASKGRSTCVEKIST